MKRFLPNTVFRFSRSYRRPPRWTMGGSSRPPGRPRRWWQKLADPLFYLRAVIVASGLALVGLPLLTDGVLTVTRPIAFGADNCRILHVVDGDTADIWCSTNGMERVRFVGFDAPELFSPDCLSELVAAQKAKWALRGFLFGNADLRLQRGGLDRYQRRLVTLWIGATPLAQKMVKAGYARPYSGGFRSGWCSQGKYS